MPDFERQTQLGEYERLLEAYYPDLPDEWDCYEDMEFIKNALAQGKTAQEIFAAQHGSWFQAVSSKLDARYDGSEFGD